MRHTLVTLLFVAILVLPLATRSHQAGGDGSPPWDGRVQYFKYATQDAETVDTGLCPTAGHTNTTMEACAPGVNPAFFAFKSMNIFPGKVFIKRVTCRTYATITGGDGFSVFVYATDGTQDASSTGELVFDSSYTPWSSATQTFNEWIGFDEGTYLTLSYRDITGTHSTSLGCGVEVILP